MAGWCSHCRISWCVSPSSSHQVALTLPSTSTTRDKDILDSLDEYGDHASPSTTTTADNRTNDDDDDGTQHSHARRASWVGMAGCVVLPPLSLEVRTPLLFVEFRDYFQHQVDTHGGRLGTRRRLRWCWPNGHTISRKATAMEPLPAKSVVSSRDGRATSVDVFRRSRRRLALPQTTKTAGQGVPAVFSQPCAHNGSGRSRPGAVAVSTGAGEVLVSPTRTRPVPFPTSYECSSLSKVKHVEADRVI
jgi:hypothetical protein